MSAFYDPFSEADRQVLKQLRHQGPQRAVDAIDAALREIDHLRILLSERQEHREAQEDRCRVCHRLIGVGVPFLHLGICEACSGPEAG